MIKCANEGCNKDSDTLDAVLLNADGDFACSKTCAEQYKQQCDHFLNNVLPDDRKFAEWTNSLLKG